MVRTSIAARKKMVSTLVAVIFTFVIACGFVPAAMANPLSDIEGHWAEQTITNMVTAGNITGYPDGTFRPEGNITRAEFTSILVRSFDLTDNEGKVFSDTAGHWARQAIATANAHGIINGYSDTLFGPDDPVTREQMAVMIVNAASLESENGAAFADGADISAWAEAAVSAAVAAGIINGYPDNTFKPQGNATRAEAAAVIYRAISTDEEATEENEEAVIEEEEAVVEEEEAVQEEDEVTGEEDEDEGLTEEDEDVEDQEEDEEEENAPNNG